MKKFGGNFSLFCIRSWSIIKATVSVEVQILSSFEFFIAPPIDAITSARKKKYSGKKKESNLDSRQPS